MKRANICEKHPGYIQNQFCPRCQKNYCASCIKTHQCTLDDFKNSLKKDLETLSDSTLNLLVKVRRLQKDANEVFDSRNGDNILEMKNKLLSLKLYNNSEIKSKIQKNILDIDRCISASHEWYKNSTKAIESAKKDPKNKPILLFKCHKCHISLRNINGYLCKICPKLFICEKCQDAHPRNHPYYYITGLKKVKEEVKKEIKEEIRENTKYVIMENIEENYFNYTVSNLLIQETDELFKDLLNNNYDEDNFVEINNDQMELVKTLKRIYKDKSKDEIMRVLVYSSFDIEKAGSILSETQFA